MFPRIFTGLQRATAGLYRGRAVAAAYSSLAQSHNFTLPPESFQLHKLNSGPSLESVITREECIAYYKEMVEVREMELAARDLYQKKIIRGFLHLFVGQEACCTGMEAALTKEDHLITAYRCHAWTYTRGATMKGILAELTGKSSGVSNGKGGSMHMYGKNYYGGNGIVGAQVPLGAGIGFALKYNDSDRICVTLYGDGAANQGQVFEAFNMAALWKLPCLFVCENNRYGMGTAQHRAAASTEFYTRGDYIPGIRSMIAVVTVDSPVVGSTPEDYYRALIAAFKYKVAVMVNGQDILAVREATKFCADYIRAGNGPLLMELDTYRYYGHSMSDPGKSYRDASEVKAVRKDRDPINLLTAYALDGNLVTEEELKEVRSTALKAVDEAVAFCLQGEELPVPELYTDVYVNQGDMRIRGCDPFTWNTTAV